MPVEAAGWLRPRPAAGGHGGQPAFVASGLGALLGALRAAQGWSLRALCSAAGVASTSMAHAAETTDHASPATLYALAQAYGLPPAALAPAAPPVAVALPLAGHPALIHAVRLFARRVGVLVEGEGEG